jgi:hypothetical protein
MTRHATISAIGRGGERERLPLEANEAAQEIDKKAPGAAATVRTQGQHAGRVDEQRKHDQTGEQSDAQPDKFALDALRHDHRPPPRDRARPRAS